MAPLVSVAMPVYNGEPYLRDAIASVLAQTCAELEFVIVDDGSTDATPEILKETAAGDRRVVVHRQPNAGHTAARNLACRLARAPLIACFDADDIAHPDRLRRQREFLLTHPNVAAVGGAVELIDERGERFATRAPSTTHVSLCRILEHASPFFHSSVMLRKDTFESVGGYRAQFGPADDYDLWLRLAARYELAGIPDVTGGYRVHLSMMSARQVDEEGLLSFAARLSAKARAAGKSDPLASVQHIDRETLLGLDVDQRDITEAIVDMTTWLAKTLGRAGYEREDVLFSRALALARDESGSPALVTRVLSQRATRRHEQGRRWRATVDSLRAKWVLRSSWWPVRGRP